VTEETATPERTLVIEPGTSARLAREYTVWQFTRLFLLIPVVVLVVAVVIAAALNAVAGKGTDLFIPIVLVLAIAGGAVGTYVASKRSISLSYPDGYIAQVTFTGEELSSETAIGTGTLKVRALRNVYTTPSAILLVMRGSLAVGILPRPLLSPEALDRLCTAVIAARAAK
jgi:hypothetical protein